MGALLARQQAKSGIDVALEHAQPHFALAHVTPIGADPREEALVAVKAQLREGVEEAAKASRKTGALAGEVAQLKAEVDRLCPTEAPAAFARPSRRSKGHDAEAEHTCEDIRRHLAGTQSALRPALIAANDSVWKARKAVNAIEQALVEPAFGGSPDYLPKIQPPENLGGAGQECHLECSHIDPAVTWPPSAAERAAAFL
eukprot:TRINITY_DN124831_c0_g1_i1.p2 TRINITY_DN124831_c0_g1~~TRINITY_DN124831_c0_g1_i1.p2  ORF type:complete len:200 (+),score=57.78 TRINITY_DN124831_c0_g1_i1:46-645(+)